MPKSLAVVGAGAKAAAIVARAAVLRQLFGDETVPDIHVFEARHIASAWDGEGTHSSGFLRLCTPGEKDVGFPYAELDPSMNAATAVGSALFARFSFQSYLVATGKYAEWVDRGRDHPSHSRWADYFKWVFKQAGQSVIKAEVTSLKPKGGRWLIHYGDDPAHPETMAVDGVVLTGTGRARTVPCTADVPYDRVFDADTFWNKRETVASLSEGTIMIAGDGGAAGAIVAWLIGRLAETDVQIISVNPMGTLFARGDGYAERRWFSDPGEWNQLSLKHRRTILSHTESGVISIRNKAIIDQSPTVGYRRGKALEADWDIDSLLVTVGYGAEDSETVGVDYLISAIGFDSWSHLDLIDHPAAVDMRMPGSDDQRDRIEADMPADLSMPSISGLPGGLHIPALGGLTHGPGIGNLGCLGLMAKSILDSYI